MGASNMSKRIFKPLEMRLITEEWLSPEQYLKLSDSDRQNIKSTQIVPPNLGDRHFGKIKITRKTPVYVMS